MNILTLLVGIILIEVTYLVYKSVHKSVRRSKTGLLIDTSALMDGRIVTAAQTGFLPSDLIVTRSVINELQLLADQADHEKRSRARRGLDAVKELQDIAYLNVSIIEDGQLDSGGVDERLIELAKELSASMCTIDFNLNKAATALGVRVLNINELAGSLRMAFLPGETISLQLAQKGQSSNQAVGYLADGTMVVVDKAGSLIGQTVEVEFIRSLQTAAGRMMFAKVLNGNDNNAKPVAKSGGRTPISRKTESAASQPSVKKDPATSRTNQNARKNSSRPQRRTHEDSLIELVNKQ